MLKQIKVWLPLHETKKCTLSFLWNLVRDETSFMSDGSAFQARGAAMEKALSVKPVYTIQPVVKPVAQPV